MNESKRARRTGRYTFSDFDKKCVICGQRLGQHEAEAPHAQGDESIGKLCPGFKPIMSETETETVTRYRVTIWRTGQALPFRRYDFFGNTRDDAEGAALDHAELDPLLKEALRDRLDADTYRVEESYRDIERDKVK